jgi:hypothetical protein
VTLGPLENRERVAEVMNGFPAVRWERYCDLPARGQGWVFGWLKGADGGAAFVALHWWVGDEGEWSFATEACERVEIGFGDLVYNAVRLDPVEAEAERQARDYLDEMRGGDHAI